MSQHFLLEGTGSAKTRSTFAPGRSPSGSAEACPFCRSGRSGHMCQGKEIVELVAKGIIARIVREGAVQDCTGSRGPAFSVSFSNPVVSLRFMPPYEGLQT